MKFLLPATKLGQGNVFTGVCDSVNGGVLSQHALQVVSQHVLQQVSWGGVAIPPSIAGGIQACLAAEGVCSWGGLLQGAWSGGWLLPGRVWPSVMAFCCGLLLCPSVMAFWFGGLLIEGGLLVWPSGGAEGHNRRHHTRRPGGDPPHPDGYCCGWYTSYWNAFLLIKFLCNFVHRNQLGH